MNLINVKLQQITHDLNPLAEWNFPLFPFEPVYFHFKGCRVVFILFIQVSIEYFVSKKSGDPDQMPHFVPCDMCLHCLSMSHKRMLGLYGLI